MLLRSCILIITYLLSYEISAQETISGYVMDKKTGEPLPYTHIIIKNTNQGAITNEDGFFRTICSDKDTLVFSFISYERQELPCWYFVENEICYLTPSINELETVAVYASLDYLIDAFIKARNKHYRTESYVSKTYFTLETSSFGEPVEMLECYYNADVHPNGIRELILKNGRIGISNIGDGYFVSLSSTKVISGYDLINPEGIKLPQNPLQLSKKKLGKTYNLELISFENGVYEIKFTPKKNTVNFFKSHVLIDKKSMQIIKIVLFENNLKKHPFIEINPNHSLDSLNYYVAYTYRNDSTHLLQKIEFKYDFNYENSIKTRKMKSGGVFLFYDQRNIFDQPYYDEEMTISDYDKIVFQPYDELFWKFNKILIPSKKIIKYREFFTENGILLNYNELSGYYHIFRNKIIPWSEERIFLFELNYVGQYNANVLSLSAPSKTNKETVFSDFNFSYQIYLDRNIFGGITFYKAETLINLDKSFYSRKMNKNTTSFINIYFDMVEIDKRKMIRVLENNEWNKQQVDSIYKLTVKGLDRELNQYLKLVFFGINDADLLFYSEKVNKELKIDNTKLIIADEFMSANDGNEMIDVYNYGSKLFNEDKYQHSLEVLLKSYHSGDTHPWLYYNLGLNYLVLNELDNACWFFKKSQDFGEILDPYFIKKCEDRVFGTNE